MRDKHDIHTLNWDLITKEPCHTQGTVSSTPVDNKGIVFEDLIEKLLVAMYPWETWRRTNKSHDGKRDFVYPENENLPDQKWAECKNYNSNVSLNVIAPTLIMGAIEKIGTILFFSYSPLNENAVEGILRYSEHTGQDVQIYDGELLERLIYKYHSLQGIRDFFPKTDFKDDRQVLKDRSIRIIKGLRTPNGNKLLPSHLFELGERFSIHIIVQNLSLDSVDYTLSIQSSRPNVVAFSNQETVYRLPRAAIKEFTIPCQALMPGSTTYVVRLLSQEPGANKCEVRGQIKVTDEPYLFWSGKCALKAQRDAMDHLCNDQPDPLVVAAESGTGKTTLIDILLHERAILEKYTVLKLDLRQSRNYCVRNILSQAVGMSTTDSTPEDQAEEDQLTLKLLMHMFAESAETLAEAILRFYNRDKPFLFVIDDIQKIDRAYIDLITELDAKSKNEEKPIYYLFALNTDIASSDDILSRLNWDRPYHERKYRIISLHRFDRADILAFLKHKFGLTAIDQFFCGFDNKIRPIEMRSFCANLKQQNIISPVPTVVGRQATYQVVDRLKFSEAVNQVLYANQSINAIWATLKNDDVALYVLKYLYIADTIGPEFREKYLKQIDSLFSLGMLKEADGKIIFGHDEIRRCARDNLVFLEEDYADIYGDKNADEATKAICAMNQVGRLRGGNAFLQNFFLQDRELAQTNQRRELWHLVFENLDKLYDSGLISDALHFARYHFTALKNEHGYITLFWFLKQTANAALSGLWDASEESVESMAYLIKKYFDCALTTRNYQDCLSYYPKYDAVFQKLSYVSPQKRDYWLAHYTNRLAIMCDRDSTPLDKEPSSATDYYTQSSDYCMRAGAPADLLFQICVDDFNRHYVYRHDLTLPHVTKAHDVLTGIKQNSTFSSASLDYHLLLLEYLRYAMGGAKELSEDFIPRVKRVRKECTSPFYKLKLYMLECYFLIEQNTLSGVEALLARAVDLAYKKELRQHIYKLTYIRAHVQIFKDGGRVTEESFELLVLAFEQLMDTRGGFIKDLEREIFLIVRLISQLLPNEEKRIMALANRKTENVQRLLQTLCSTGKPTISQNPLLAMQSYFMYRDISFPPI